MLECFLVLDYKTMSGSDIVAAIQEHKDLAIRDGEGCHQFAFNADSSRITTALQGAVANVCAATIKQVRDITNSAQDASKSAAKLCDDHRDACEAIQSNNLRRNKLENDLETLQSRVKAESVGRDRTVESLSVHDRELSNISQMMASVIEHMKNVDSVMKTTVLVPINTALIGSSFHVIAALPASHPCNIIVSTKELNTKTDPAFRSLAATQKLGGPNILCNNNLRARNSSIKYSCLTKGGYHRLRISYNHDYFVYFVTQQPIDPNATIVPAIKSMETKKQAEINAMHEAIAKSTNIIDEMQRAIEGNCEQTQEVDADLIALREQCSKLETMAADNEEVYEGLVDEKTKLQQRFAENQDRQDAHWVHDTLRRNGLISHKLDNLTELEDGVTALFTLFDRIHLRKIQASSA